jgi:hypothetical protein
MSPKVVNADTNEQRPAARKKLREKSMGNLGEWEKPYATIWMNCGDGRFASVAVPKVSRFSKRGKEKLNAPNPSKGEIDDASEFGGVFGRAIALEALLGFFGRKPGGIAVRFARLLEPGHVAKMSVGGNLRGRSVPPCTFTAYVMREGGFLDASMNAGFLEGLERGRLGVRETGLNTAFREGPVSAASANQQEFDGAAAHAITDRRDLFASAQFSKLREGKEFESAGLC